MKVFACTSCTEFSPGASAGFVPMACAGVFLGRADPMPHWATPDAMRARGITATALDFENWDEDTEWDTVGHVARRLAVLTQPRWILATPGENAEQRPTKKRARVMAELRQLSKMPIAQLVGGIDRYGYAVTPAARDGSMTAKELDQTVRRARFAVLEAAEVFPKREVGLWVQSHWFPEKPWAHVAGLPMPRNYAAAMLGLFVELRGLLGDRFSATVWYGWALSEARLYRESGGRHDINWNAPQTWAELAESPVITALTSLIGGVNDGSK